MGKTDGYESEMLDNNELFADLVNGILFQGKRIIKGSDLKELDSELLSMERGQNRKIIRDKAKLWKNTIFAVIAVENQNYIDYRMVTRVMLAESMEYDRQWRKLHNIHKQKHDLKGMNEFLSGIKEKEKFYPVVTIVVYYGEKPWNGPRCLYEQLEFGDKEKLLKPYICNYTINIFDYHDFDKFDCFQTELQCLFEILRYAEDKKSLSSRMEKKRDLYSKLSKTTAMLVTKLTRIKVQFQDEKGEDEMADLIKAVRDMVEEGREEGKALGMINVLKKYNESDESILDELTNTLIISMEQAQKYLEMYKEV